MENFATLLIPVFFGVLLVRFLLLPVGWLLKLGVHSACGFICLWLLNTVSAFTGIAFPINAVTVLTAGFLGIPGIGLMAVLAIL
jgi:inhibitor of the pro-sigma K processing machinery